MDNLLKSGPLHILVLVHCTTYEAAVVENILLFLFLASERSKCVNDDSKEQVEDDDDDEEKVQEVEHYSARKKWILK